MRPLRSTWPPMVLILVSTLLFVSCSDEECALCPPPCEPSGWVLQPSPTAESLTSLHVFDRNSAIAVGTAGTIVRTADGGSGWTLVDAGTTATLRDVFFLDDTHGWIVGDDGTALASTDGGWTWAPFVVPVSVTLREVVFVDRDTGFIGGGPIADQTGDPVFLQTIDGGAQWNVHIWPFTIRTMFFADVDHGWAGGGGNLERTVDGGVSWSSSPHGHVGWLGCVYFADPLNGWVSGGAGFIASSTDGGISWETQNGGTTRNIVENFALDPARAWYVARSPGAVAGTTDGGITWYFQTIPDGAIPADVAFADGETGWIVGSDGLILKTVSGGR